MLLENEIFNRGMLIASILSLDLLNQNQNKIPEENLQNLI